MSDLNDKNRCNRLIIIGLTSHGREDSNFIPLISSFRPADNQLFTFLLIVYNEVALSEICPRTRLPVSIVKTSNVGTFFTILPMTS